MKHLFTDLWANIRKSPFLFLFLFIQIVITSLVLYIVLANYYWIEERSSSAQISWGDKEYLKLFTKDNAPIDEWLAISGSRIPVSPDKKEEYQYYIQLFEQVERFYTDVQKIDGLKLISDKNSIKINLLAPKEWETEDQKFGGHNMFVDYGQDK